MEEEDIDGAWRLRLRRQARRRLNARAKWGSGSCYEAAAAAAEAATEAWTMDGGEMRTEVGGVEMGCGFRRS